MKTYEICGIGNGIVDIVVRLSEEEFISLGLERGVAVSVNNQVRDEILQRYARRDHLISGG